MLDKVVRIQTGESLPFTFDRGGATIEDWTCQIFIKQRPDDFRTVDRSIIAENDFEFKGFLRADETLNLDEGLWHLIGILNNPFTDEQEEIPIRFSVAKSSVITPSVAPPVFSPPPGIFQDDVTVNITTPTPDAIIHFTQNGSEPTIFSPIFSTPIFLTISGSPHTLKALAVKPGLIDSITSSAVYIVQQIVASVTFLPVAGTIIDTQTITLLTSTSGATIHFTTNGDTPTRDSSVFEDAFLLPLGVQTVKAFAVKTDFIDSDETQAIYTVQDMVEPVTFSPVAGIISNLQMINLATITSGATIHYTTDGSDPDGDSTEFPPAFVLPIGMQTVRAIGIEAGLFDSIITQAIYDVKEQVLPVTFSPPAGNIFDDTEISLATPTSGAVIHYTTDGTDPTAGSTVFPPTFTLLAGMKTVKAIAIKVGGLNSVITEALYDVASTFDPLSIMGIVFWIDANDSDSITPQPAVQQWKDQSSNNNHFQQNTGSRQPQHITTETPNLVRFDGTADFMDNINTGDFNQPNTYFLVARSIENREQVMFDSLNFLFLNIFFENAVPPLYAMGSPTFVSAGKTANTDKNILTPIFDGASSRFYLNGGSTSAIDPGTRRMIGFKLGASNGPANFAKYDFYDVLFYNRLLTVTELNNLGVFFAAKHSLTWTTITV